MTEIEEFSHIPYSNTSEYCYVLGTSGAVYPGVRVENISFPLTIPADQAAICSCLGNKDRPEAIIRKKTEQQLTDFWIHKFDLVEMESLPVGADLYNPILKNVENVKQSLKELCKKSVSEESEFPVSALLRVKDGYIPGVNVEFKEWNIGLCAERVAISRALAYGYSQFLDIHIYAPKSEYISPCGACRQVLLELMPEQVAILHHDDQSQSKHQVSHLLPNGFISTSLKNK